MRGFRQSVGGCAVAVAIAACSGSPAPAPARPAGGTTVDVAGGQPPVAGFEPPAPLGQPDPPHPGKPHLDYLRAMHPALGQAWRGFVDNCRGRLPADHPLNGAGLSAVVELILDGAGAVTSARLAASSGNAEFDGVAVDIARDAGPFPAPPPTAISDDGAVRVRWRLSRDRRLAGVATAELRRVLWPVERAVPALVAAGDAAEAARRIAEASARPGADPAALVALLDGVAVAAVRAGLTGGDGDVQLAAIAAVRRARLRAALPELARLADSAADLAVRRRAVWALAGVGGARARAVVEGLWRDAAADRPADDVVANAEALAELGGAAAVVAKVRGWLGSGDDEQRWRALAVMARVAVDDAVPELAALVRTSRAPRPERLAAQAGLAAVASGTGSAADAATAALVACVKSPDAQLRGGCAEALSTVARGAGRSRVRYTSIRKLLRDPDDRVRAAALVAAAHIDPRRLWADASARRGALLSGSDVVLGAVADALAVVPGAPARARLVELAGHDAAEVRRRAARSLLRRREDAEARRALAGLITDRDVEVRATAVAAVSDADTLVGQLDADAEDVRVAAAAALIARGGKAAALSHVAERLVAAGPRERIRVAGAWLARGP